MITFVILLTFRRASGSTLLSVMIRSQDSMGHKWYRASVPILVLSTRRMSSAAESNNVIVRQLDWCSDWWSFGPGHIMFWDVGWDRGNLNSRMNQSVRLTRISWILVATVLFSKAISRAKDHLIRSKTVTAACWELAYLCFACSSRNRRSRQPFCRAARFTRSGHCLTLLLPSYWRRPPEEEKPTREKQCGQSLVRGADLELNSCGQLTIPGKAWLPWP